VHRAGPARASTKESRPMDLKKIASDLASVLLFGLFIVAADPSPLLAEDAAAARTVAFLGVQLQNDNEGLEPTTDAERARMKEIEELFESKLDGSGRFKFVPVPPETMKEIAAGQNIGDCHGCEVEYGRKLHADLIAWIKVQNTLKRLLLAVTFPRCLTPRSGTFFLSTALVAWRCNQMRVTRLLM
jgi:Protein of unknown function (DUF2380)